MLDHLADIESDMSAVHRVADMRAMPSRRFFCFAERLHAYRGVMRMRAEIAAEQEEEPAPRPDPRLAVPQQPEKKIHVKDITLNPELMPYFDGPEEAHGVQGR